MSLEGAMNLVTVPGLSINFLSFFSEALWLPQLRTRTATLADFFFNIKHLLGFF